VPYDAYAGLEEMVRRARRKLPLRHGALLDQIGVQDAVQREWPHGVTNLYVTIGETPPAAGDVDGALAVWLQAVRVVAYNGPLLIAALDLDASNAEVHQPVVNNLAWHEYGHALSVTRSTSAHRADGVRLLGLLPPNMRQSISFPGEYRRYEVFDEVIAHVYPLMVGRAIRGDGYVAPDFLDPDVFDAFKEVIPWPPSP
jgi:hypothetical protein